MGSQRGEWTVGLGIQVEMANGLVNSWSEQLSIVGSEDGARKEAVARLRSRLATDWPQAHRIEVSVFSSRPAGQ